MSAFDDYIATVTPAQQAELERVRSIVRQDVPSAEEGVSYAMPAFMVRGKPFLSVMVRKKHLSLYPFSGKVIEKLSEKLSDYSLTSGSIHYSEANPVPEPLLKEIIAARLQEIEAKLQAP